MLIKAINNGDWFSASTWDTSNVPTANDDVYLNGYNLTANNTIHFNTLSNRSAEDINEGGKITFSSFSGNILCQGGDIYATNNIFTWGNWTATVEANKIYSYTQYTVAQQRTYTTFYSTWNANYNNVLLYITANKIITDENSVGMLVFSAYTGAAYRTLVISADIEHNGGFISDTLSAYGANGLLNGNVVCRTQLFSVNFVNNHISGRYCTVNGNILCMDFEEPFVCNSNYFNGDLTFNGNGNYNLSLRIQSFNGNITYNGSGLLSLGGAYYGNIYNNSTNTNYGSAWGTCTINNYYDNSTSTYFSNLATTVNMTLTGEFHYNYHQAFTNNAYYTGFRKITTTDNGKIYIKGNNNYLLSTYLEINNPDRFAYNFVDITPNWLIIPYESSPNVYPSETDVRKDVPYAYGAKVGKLEPVTVDATNTINVYPYKKRQ